MSEKKFISEQFSEMIVNADYDKMDQVAQENAKWILLDYLGNLIGSKISDTTENSIKIAESLGGAEECTIIGSQIKVSAMNAVLSNAIGGYSFDFVDDHNDSCAHPSPATIPAALTLAEKYGLDGKAFITAYIVGNEVIARAGSVYLGDMPKQAFHPSSVLGTMGATAVACKAMNLTLEQCTHAQGMAVTSMAAGLYSWNSYNNTAKRINASQPARNGMLAAILAEGGLTGPKDVYEGRFGAFNAFSFEKNWDSAQAVRNMGTEWQFANSSIKPYPACRYSGGNIDACLDVRSKHAVVLDDIQEIIFASQRAQIDNIMLPIEHKMNPTNMVEMQHSLPYCGAIALAKGRFTVKDLNLENLKDPTISRLMSITTYRIDEELEARYPESYSTSVILKMKNGEEVKGEIEYPLGDWRNPVDHEFIKNKFRSLAGLAIDDMDRIERIIEIVLNIEKQDTITELMQLINFAN